MYRLDISNTSALLRRRSILKSREGCWPGMTLPPPPLTLTPSESPPPAMVIDERNESGSTARRLSNWAFSRLRYCFSTRLCDLRDFRSSGVSSGRGWMFLGTREALLSFPLFLLNAAAAAAALPFAVWTPSRNTTGPAGPAAAAVLNGEPRDIGVMTWLEAFFSPLSHGPSSLLLHVSIDSVVVWTH